MIMTLLFALGVASGLFCVYTKSSKFALIAGIVSSISLTIGTSLIDKDSSSLNKMYPWNYPVLLALTSFWLVYCRRKVKSMRSVDLPDASESGRDHEGYHLSTFFRCFFKNYLNFHGRAGLLEFWTYLTFLLLYQTILSIPLLTGDGIDSSWLLFLIGGDILVAPAVFAAYVRRCHDLNIYGIKMLHPFHVFHPFWQKS